MHPWASTAIGALTNCMTHVGQSAVPRLHMEVVVHSQGWRELPRQVRVALTPHIREAKQHRGTGAHCACTTAGKVPHPATVLCLTHTTVVVPGAVRQVRTTCKPGQHFLHWWRRGQDVLFGVLHVLTCEI